MPVNELPTWLKHLTLWLLLGLGGFLGVQAWQSRERATRLVVLEGQRIEIRRAPDGHYHWRGRLSGREVEFLVDTGATRSAIPAQLAESLGLPVVGSLSADTANGRVQGAVVVGDLVLEGGVQVDRLRLAALPELGAPLLGMDVMGRLAWQQNQGVLRIEPGSAPR